MFALLSNNIKQASHLSYNSHKNLFFLVFHIILYFYFKKGLFFLYHPMISMSVPVVAVGGAVIVVMEISGESCCKLSAVTSSIV
jgi:hypothetical protein